MLQILDVKSSKAEEIETLHTFVDEICGQQTYLSSLFTKELLNWAEEKILNDIAPDLYGFIKECQRETTQARGLASQWEISFQTLNKKLESCEEQLKQVIQTNSEENSQLRADFIKRLSKWSRVYDERTEELKKVKDELFQAKQTIGELKVMLFDKEHPMKEIPD